MTNEELNAKLFEKATKEQEEYKAKLLSMSPQQILDNAYPYIVREDILISLENNELDGNRAKALLKSKHPLYDIYNLYADLETGYMNGIRDVIEETADKLIKDAKSKAHRDAR